ncbi:MAG: 4-(cytidine 5'-diphospho)-2-C-methyl-D-erythritol kinase [Bacillota bacterium]
MIKEKAHAKINLFLDILGKRLDNFHDLEMIMVSLKLHDTLTFTKRSDDKIVLHSDKTITENVEDNLIYKIIRHMLDAYLIEKGVDVHIEKRIPIAAGLAGGSADAAATLRGVNRLFNLKLSLDQLAEIGVTFGADIPFCVHNRLCIARGKGEDLFFLKRNLKMPVLLVTPQIEVSTKRVFDHVDMDKVENVKITTMTNAIYNKNYELLVRNVHNALEPFSFELFPEIKKLKDSLKTEGADAVIMSGSGPTLVVFDKDTHRLKDLADKYRETHTVHLTKTL